VAETVWLGHWIRPQALANHIISTTLIF